jgi:hypothetical protein
MTEQKLGSFEAVRTAALSSGTGEKPLELQLQSKDSVAAALTALEKALPGRLHADPKLKA